MRILLYKPLDHVSQTLANVCSLSLLLDLEELRNCGVLDSELKMVHLSVEMDHFLI